ncbi:hypothetical protein [Chryseobacterium sp. T20]|uniref:hypothetical protein n=1 Tax=Chryseobacterium sp. T20 TaxID=3395375 RepID=UPI0039BD3F32
MKKNLLLAGLLTTFSLVAKSQVGINTTNPQGVFNIDGLKNNPTTGVPTAAQAKDDLVTTSNGNLGLGVINPGTTLDVNGAITNRETALAISGNAVTIPANVSLVKLTGAATGNVAISAFAAPNPGQRLIVYNNTTGGFGATLDGVTIPNNTTMEFVFTNSFWRSIDGGMLIAGPTNIYTANGTLAGNRVVTTQGNLLSFNNVANTVSIGTGGNETIVRANGFSRGSYIATGGNANLNMYVDDNGKATLTTSGNNTGMDIGAATADPVNILTNNTQRVIVTGTGNIGVNIPAPDASAILDINGINRGILLPRVLLNSITDGSTVPNPANGLVVYNNNASMAPYKTGIYYNSGTPAAPYWLKLAPQTTDYQLLDVFTDVATFPVDWAAVGSGNIVDNIDLGLSVFVTIPANSTVKIVIDYNVPMGTSTQGANGQRGYYGVRFLRNGAEAPEGSRKFTVPEGPTGSEMISLSGKFAETYTNTNAFPLTATYTLNGYVESTTYPTRFNMWSASGANFNWGKASMVATVFAKDN